MLARDKNKLLIFEDFLVDRNLIKYRKDTKNNDTQNEDEDSFDVRDRSRLMARAVRNTILELEKNPDIDYDYIESIYQEMEQIYDTPYIIRVFYKWKLFLHKKYPTVFPLGRKINKRLPVSEFFNSIKLATETLQDSFNKRTESYKKLLDSAKENGQIALYDNLVSSIRIVTEESKLYALGLKQFLNEKDVVKFASLSSKALYLDWIRHFNRIIPTKILDIKKKCDELRIFDNYVILHYDPTGTGSSETKDEKIHREKDPILFGVIEDSRKLYYIGDWVDEYCDLTLDKIADVLGKDIIKANNLTANVKLS